MFEKLCSASYFKEGVISRTALLKAYSGDQVKVEKYISTGFSMDFLGQRGCHKLKLENGKVCLMQQVGRSRQLEKLDKSQVGCPGIRKTEQLLFLMSHLVRGTVCQAQCHLDLSFE